MSSTSNAPRQFASVSRTIGGKVVTIETGRLAKQASGAVVVRLGDTMTLVATVAGPGREGLERGRLKLAGHPDERKLTA